MFEEANSKKLSKFLSWVLRHKPEAIGIELDENGWTSVDLLIENCRKADVALDMDLLQHIVATNTKKRFSFNDGMDKIRANQGHSVEVNLAYSSTEPPEILYHGTSVKFVDSILQNGLQKQERHHVHLSKDIETALQVGQRHGKPFVFEVLAGEMHNRGFQFFLSDNGVWLTNNVPVEYLRELKR